MTLEEGLREELEKLEEESDDVVDETKDAASRRLQDDWLGRVAVIVAFILIGFANMGLSWLQGEGIITPEGMITVLLGVTLYVAFRILNHFYNFMSLKLQERAIALDIKELTATKTRVELQVTQLDEQRRISREDMQFLKHQNRIDIKLNQDLQLRIPFFQEAQKELMNFFGREDIVAALQVPPTFVEAIEKIDDALLKRTDIDLKMKDVATSILKISESVTILQTSALENAEMIKILIQREAELTAKIHEDHLKIATIETIIQSLNETVGNMACLLNGQTTQPLPKEKIKSTSIASQTEDLLKETTEKEEDTGDLTPPPA